MFQVNEIDTQNGREMGTSEKSKQLSSLETKVNCSSSRYWVGGQGTSMEKKNNNLEMAVRS